MTMWRGLHNPDYHEDITEYEVERLTAERDALRASVQRVRDLHVPSQTVKSRISGLPVCCRCHDIYPCETLRALAGDGHE